ncbi:folate-binding protein YgfZ [Piscinibacter sp. HJYY11]|nr:folate-binding protein YgfZ [Piscinibacter sp. HJYY11]MBL0726665.1 folate-binding protein YgfZ [Piscinibacter sp. HJYY11]
MTTSSALDGAAPLPHWGLIRAQGDDAASFLHSQLTNDFSLLGTAEARLAGYCSAKGRLLASFIGWKRSGDDILLACSADLLAATQKRLSMFVLRAKCKLSDASPQWRLLGLTGPSAQAWLGSAAPSTVWGKTTHEGADVVRLPDVDGTARFLWAAPLDVTPPALPALDEAAWRVSEVKSGVARIEAATVDQFVPQMLNYEVLGGVDFKKGCYPGQEVVARSQYRGTIKRRSFLFSSSAALQAGQEVFHDADPSQPAGLVVNAASPLALVELKLTALEGGTVHVGSADGPALIREELPYLLPVADAA